MRAAAIAACLLGLAGSAAAQTYTVQVVPPQPARGYDNVRLSKAALPGQEVRIWWAAMIDPDCSAHGSMTTTVVDQPRSGEVRLSEEPLYVQFPPQNARSACNARRVPGRQAFYTARADFRGHDKVVLQNATSEGRIRKIVIDIEVR